MRIRDQGEVHGYLLGIRGAFYINLYHRLTLPGPTRTAKIAPPRRRVMDGIAPSGAPTIKFNFKAAS